MRRTLTVLSLAISATVSAGLFSASVLANDQVINLYSARHYPTDEALYSDFTKATGIKINRVDSDDAGIIARLKAEGSASPADVILLVDAARLWKGEVDGMFLPVKSKTLWKPPFLRNCALNPRTREPLGLACPPAHAWWCTTSSKSNAKTWTPTKNWPTPKTKASCASARARTPTT